MLRVAASPFMDFASKEAGRFAGFIANGDVNVAQGSGGIVSAGSKQISQRDRRLSVLH